MHFDRQDDKGCPRIQAGTGARSPLAWGVRLWTLDFGPWTLDGLDTTNQRKAFGVFYRFYREVNIEIGPVKVVGVEQLDIQHLSDRHILKPRKMLERQKHLPLPHQEPETVLGNIRNLNRRSACSTQRGSHSRVSE